MKRNYSIEPYVIITGDEYHVLWKEFEIEVEFSKETREQILEMESNTYKFMICHMANVILFDTEFMLPIKGENFDAGERLGKAKEYGGDKYG